MGSGGWGQLRLDEGEVVVERGDAEDGFVLALGLVLELLLAGHAWPRHCGPSSSLLLLMAALIGALVEAAHLWWVLNFTVHDSNSGMGHVKMIVSLEIA
jgi:hypothetical protein